MNKGRIVQIMGPVIDINFEGGELPALYNAIHLKSPENENEKIVLEVAQQDVHPSKFGMLGRCTARAGHDREMTVDLGA